MLQTIITLLLSTFLSFASQFCGAKDSRSTYLVPIRLPLQKHTVDVPSVSDTYFFADYFWTEFLYRFPSASEALISSSFTDTTIGIVSVTDSGYFCQPLSKSNRMWILMHIPSDLRKSSSTKYKRLDGFFRTGDATYQKLIKRTKWSPASLAFEKDYSTFRKMLLGHQNFLFIVSKQFKTKLQRILAS